MNVDDSVNLPARRPCATCPYRVDVPSGIWDPSEYAKLPPYDAETPFQPHHLFLCHQTRADDPGARLCAGWVGTHDMDHSLALRLAVRNGDISPADFETIAEYTTDVALFDSGQAAAAHGSAQVASPGPQAVDALRKIGRKRSLRRARPTR